MALAAGGVVVPHGIGPVGDIVRVVLLVSVHGHDHPSPGMVEAGRQDEEVRAESFEPRQEARPVDDPLRDEEWRVGVQECLAQQIPVHTVGIGADHASHDVEIDEQNRPAHRR